MSDDTLIHHGVMYVRTCNIPVANLDSGLTSTCMKRVKHPGFIHEDYDGRRRHEIFGPNVEVLEIPMPQHMPSHEVVTREMVKAAWDAFVQPTQIAQDDQSPEWLTLAAVLRAVNEGLPQVDISTEESAQDPEISNNPPVFDAIVVDELDGPCENCKANEWTSVVDGKTNLLKCNKCGNLRRDR